MSIPIEIYYKLINYGIYQPPHYLAYKNATIRPIFSNELNCNISGEPIVLLTDEEIELNQEWEDFSAHII